MRVIEGDSPKATVICACEECCKRRGDTPLFRGVKCAYTLKRQGSLQLVPGVGKTSRD